MEGFLNDFLKISVTLELVKEEFPLFFPAHPTGHGIPPLDTWTLMGSPLGPGTVLCLAVTGWWLSSVGLAQAVGLTLVDFELCSALEEP
jgi:hypothetical protein